MKQLIILIVVEMYSCVITSVTPEASPPGIIVYPREGFVFYHAIRQAMAQRYPELGTFVCVLAAQYVGHARQRLDAGEATSLTIDDDVIDALVDAYKATMPAIVEAQLVEGIAALAEASAFAAPSRRPRRGRRRRN